MTPRRILITLTDAEIAHASLCAGLRRCSSADLKPAHGLDEAKCDPWTQEMNSVAAELAVAKATGRYWCGGVNTFKSNDVVGLQVRWSKPDTSCLLIRSSDADLDTFVLVTGHMPTFELRGYMRGAEAKNGVWFRAPNGRPGCYFVPQFALYPMAPLVDAAQVRLTEVILDIELEEQERRAIAEQS